MKPSVARAFALAAWVACFSCGPAPAPDRGVVAPLALGPATPARPAPPPKPEAAPRAPDDLALLVRVSDPEQLAKEIISILPSSAASAAAALEPPQLLMLLLGKKLGAVVDLTQSIDIASVGAHDPSFVVSMGVKQEAEAKLADTFVLREEGGLQLVMKADDGRGDSGRMSACAFTPGVGRAVTRLVCASDEGALTSAAAYLARGVASEPLDADARLTLPGKILREKKDGTAKAIGDAASARLGAELVERFLEEIDRIDADLRFAGGGVEIDLNLRLSARESMLSKMILLRSKPAVPPRAFYRLPADSAVALHTTGALAEDIAPLRKAFADNIEASLVQDGYQADKTHALRERLEGLLLTGGPMVLGMGVVGGREGVEKALAALDSSRAGEAQARAALAPWMLLEVEEAPERWSQGLRDLVKRADDADRTRTPGSKSSTPHDPDSDHFDLRIGTLDPALKLPKDSLHLEVIITPFTKGKHPSRKGHLFVVPKGAATWIGYSEDLNGIVSRLRLAIDDATEVGTLAKSTEAASLRARPALAAGLLSLGGLANLTAKTATLSDLQSTARSASRLGAGGTRGTEVLTFTASADATPGSARASLHLQATRQTAADVLRMMGL